MVCWAMEARKSSHHVEAHSCRDFDSGISLRGIVIRQVRYWVDLLRTCPVPSLSLQSRLPVPLYYFTTLEGMWYTFDLCLKTAECYGVAFYPLKPWNKHILKFQSIPLL